VVVILSDFAAAPVWKEPFLPNTRFVLLHVPGREMDQKTDETRRETWKQTLAAQAAKSVCLAPLATLTPVELGRCVGTATQ
jgi:hypothetical protein